MKKWIVTILQLALTAALGWSLHNKVNFGAVGARMGQIPTVIVVASLALIGAQISVVAWRMKLVAEAMGLRCPLGGWLRSVLAGAFVGQTPLTNFGGDLVRIWCVVREGLTLPQAASIVALDRILGLASLLLMVIVSSVWLWPLARNDAMRLGISLAATGALCGLALLWLARFLPARIRRYRIGRWLSNLSATFGGILTHGRFGVGTLALGIAVNLLSVAVIYALFRSLGASVSFGECLVLVPFPLLLSLLPLSVSGWGVRESALIAAFGLIGVPGELTFSVSVSFGLILLASSLPGALFLIGYRDGVRPHSSPGEIPAPKRPGASVG